MSDPRDTGYAAPRWEFDREVSRVFSDMLKRSIPDHDTMRALVSEVARSYAAPDTAILDLGCSTGEAIADLAADPSLAGCSFVGVETSAPMLEKARERFATNPRVRIEDVDLRTTYPTGPFGVTLSVLTLQFIPMEYRARVLRNARRNAAPGGVIILVEKVLGGCSDADDFLVSRYRALKARNGYAEEEIDRKRASLEGVLVPVTAGQNEAMLRTEGWVGVECFWRYLNFAAWLAVAP